MVYTTHQTKEQVPNHATLAELLLVFPVSNATVERGFSAMKRIKSDWRNRLNEETLDNLMRISIDGPPLPDLIHRWQLNFFCNTKTTRYSTIWTKAELQRNWWLTLVHLIKNLIDNNNCIQYLINFHCSLKLLTWLLVFIFHWLPLSRDFKNLLLIIHKQLLRNSIMSSNYCHTTLM